MGSRKIGSTGLLVFALIASLTGLASASNWEVVSEGDTVVFQSRKYVSRCLVEFQYIVASDQKFRNRQDRVEYSNAYASTHTYDICNFYRTVTWKFGWAELSKRELVFKKDRANREMSGSATLKTELPIFWSNGLEGVLKIDAHWTGTDEFQYSRGAYRDYYQNLIEYENYSRIAEVVGNIGNTDISSENASSWIYGYEFRFKPEEPQY